MIERFLKQLETCSTPENAFAIYRKALELFGFDKISYSLCTDHPSLNLERLHGLSTTYPEDWMKHYEERDLYALDPVMAEIKSSRKPFFWSDLVDRIDAQNPAFDMMKQAQDVGLNDGIGISFCSNINEITGIGLSSSSGCDDLKTDMVHLGLIYLLSLHFHEKFRSFYTVEDLTHLTTREKDVLCWACEGKTDSEIAFLLHITPRTVRFHWGNIHEKLTTFSKVHAVSKALRLGLIEPGQVTVKGTCLK